MNNLNSTTLLRVANTANKAAKILGLISKILCVLSIVALAGGVALFCKQIAAKLK